MPRENALAKSHRYLAEGRLTVRRVNKAEVVAWCRGTDRFHRLGWSPDSGWWCTCPAVGACSHLLALQSVVPPEAFVNLLDVARRALDERGWAKLSASLRGVALPA